jgi:integrase
MSKHIKYAYLRHNTWIYRRAYPRHLQSLLGASLKRSLKTNDARVARTRVAEVNQTFVQIVAEAEAQGDQTTKVIPVQNQRYERPRLLGEATVGQLADTFLSERAKELRYGSFKSLRFSVGLLVSEHRKTAIGSLTKSDGERILSLIQGLSPNVRKWRQAQGLRLSELVCFGEGLREGTISVQTQSRIWGQMGQFLDWCCSKGEIMDNPWKVLAPKGKAEVAPYVALIDAEVITLLRHGEGIFRELVLLCLLTGLRSGEAVGLTKDDLIQKGNYGWFVKVRPNDVRKLKSKAAEREVPLHGMIADTLTRIIPSNRGRLFPGWTVDRVVKAFAKIRAQQGLDREGVVFHSTRKWFITQCERTGVPEHFTATLVGHQSARSANKLTYGLYSAGISDAQKREIVDQIRLPYGVDL